MDLGSSVECVNCEMWYDVYFIALVSSGLYATPLVCHV
jgi:hypothetical protein